MTWRAPNNARAMRSVHRQSANRPVELAVSCLAALTVAGLAVGIALVAMMIAAHGHEWYPPSCCSGGDCAALAEARVAPLDGGGYLIDRRFYVPRHEVKNSLDGRYHACFPTLDEVKCFFAPRNAM